MFTNEPIYEPELGDIYTPIPEFERSYTIPLCNCKLPLSVGYHRTQQQDDICVYCDHYVFYGSEMDITDVSDTNAIKYSYDLVEAVRKAYMASGNASQIAREFEISRHTVRNWSKQFNWRKK